MSVTAAARRCYVVYQNSPELWRLLRSLIFPLVSAIAQSCRFPICLSVMYDVFSGEDGRCTSSSMLCSVSLTCLVYRSRVRGSVTHETTVKVKISDIPYPQALKFQVLRLPRRFARQATSAHQGEVDPPFILGFHLFA